MDRLDLPEEFLKDMKELLGSEYNDYLSVLKDRPYSGLRVNTLKTDPDSVSRKFGGLEKIPWTENGFFISDESVFTKNPCYYAGLYYIQEPSAMTPASILGTKPGEKILDLCAAPGGKSTETGALLKGTGILFANDISVSRSKALLKNIELSGIKNAVIMCEDSGKLKGCYPEYFDRILIDAPCSGEGMFRKKPSVIRAYLEHGRDFYCPVQKKLLEDAAEMLKPGGTLLYSTCTYNRHEDEDQIIGFLNAHPDFSVDPVSLKEGFTPSVLLPGCIRLFPHRAKAEGHFAARLVKKKDSVSVTSEPLKTPGKKKETVPASVTDFLKNTESGWNPERIHVINGYAAFYPEEFECVSSIRYTRTGLLLGQIKNNRFKPSQALAMSLKMDEWKYPLNLPSGDPRVIRYLKGETLDGIPENPGHGYRLFCTDSYPLGFVKEEQGRLKNGYLPGWRWL